MIILNIDYLKALMEDIKDKSTVFWESGFGTRKKY